MIYKDIEAAVRRYQRNLVKDRAKDKAWVDSGFDDTVGRSMAATHRAKARALEHLNRLLLAEAL